MELFRKVYEFLSQSYTEEMKEDLVPLCNTKEYGLIRLFCQKVPYEYATRIVAGWKTQTFKELHDFLIEFDKALDKHYKSHRCVATDGLAFGGTG